MGINRHRARRSMVGVGLTALLATAIGAVIAQGGASAGPPKYYTATASPSVDAGTASSSTIELAITNKTTNKIAFNGVRVQIPQSLLDDAKTPLTATASSGSPVGIITDSASASGKSVQVLNANVPKDGTLRVWLNVTLPCSAGGDTYVWRVDVRQSNDFNGTDNKFDPQAPFIGNTTVDGCQLSFTTQPAAAAPGATITGDAYEPETGPAVTVTVRDGAGSTMQAWTSNVSLSLVGSGGGTLGGTTSDAGPIAEFAPNVTPRGTYQLTATSNEPVTGFELTATSDQFLIGYGGTFTCTTADQQQLCESPTVPSPNGNTAQVVINDGNTVDANLTVEFSGATAVCPGTTQQVGDVVTFDFEVVGGSLPGTVTTKTLRFTGPAVSGLEASDYQFCYRAPYNFPTLPLAASDAESVDNLVELINEGSIGTDNAGMVGSDYIGLLLPCTYVAADTDPCIDVRTLSGSDVLIEVRVPIGDPSGSMRW